MKKITNPKADQFSDLVSRPQKPMDEMNAVIKEVFDRVESEGDQALRYYTELYDGITLDSFRVPAQELEDATLKIALNLKEAIDKAYENIYLFHQAQMPSEIRVEIQEGINCWQRPVPIDAVGLYVPGGSAPLFSTILMLAIPAKIAGCKNIILCTPPDSSGDIPLAVKYAAYKCGVHNVFKVGGSQAIAAMTLGTETIRPVYKIFGPGNQYVTAAKMHAFQHGVGIDMPAGPSEVLVFADSTADPAYIAADLLSQAEHGQDSQVVLVTNFKDLIVTVESAIARQLEDLPRKEIAKKALANSMLIYCSDVKDAFQLINEYAPEHLILASEDADQYVGLVKNAGSVFIGNYTPESAGDYASGTNHTLPTAAAARSFSGVNLDAFFKKITYQKISQSGLKSLGPIISTLARAEQLEGHARAVEIRLKKLLK